MTRSSHPLFALAIKNKNTTTRPSLSSTVSPPAFLVGSFCDDLLLLLHGRGGRKSFHGRRLGTTATTPNGTHTRRRRQGQFAKVTNRHGHTGQDQYHGTQHHGHNRSRRHVFRVTRGSILDNGRTVRFGGIRFRIVRTRRFTGARAVLIVIVIRTCRPLVVVVAIVSSMANSRCSAITRAALLAIVHDIIANFVVVKGQGIRKAGSGWIGKGSLVVPGWKRHGEISTGWIRKRKRQAIIIIRPRIRHGDTIQTFSQSPVHIGLKRNIQKVV